MIVHNSLEDYLANSHAKKLAESKKKFNEVTKTTTDADYEVCIFAFVRKISPDIVVL